MANRPPQFIHSASDSVRGIGTFFVVLSIIGILVCFIWAIILAADNDPVAAPLLSGLGCVFSLFVGLLINHASTIVRASETYLFLQNDLMDQGEQDRQIREDAIVSPRPQDVSNKDGRLGSAS